MAVDGIHSPPSSPDPLALSGAGHTSPVKARALSKSKKISTPKKQSFVSERRAQIYTSGSAIARSDICATNRSPKRQQLSHENGSNDDHWRIRVTVEAGLGEEVHSSKKENAGFERARSSGAITHEEGQGAPPRTRYKGYGRPRKSDVGQSTSPLSKTRTPGVQSEVRTRFESTERSDHGPRRRRESKEREAWSGTAGTPFRRVPMQGLSYRQTPSEAPVWDQHGRFQQQPETVVNVDALQTRVGEPDTRQATSKARLPARHPEFFANITPLHKKLHQQCDSQRTAAQTLVTTDSPVPVGNVDHEGTSIDINFLSPVKGFDKANLPRGYSYETCKRNYASIHGFKTGWPGSQVWLGTQPRIRTEFAAAVNMLPGSRDHPVCRDFGSTSNLDPALATFPESEDEMSDFDGIALSDDNVEDEEEMDSDVEYVDGNQQSDNTAMLESEGFSVVSIPSLLSHRDIESAHHGESAIGLGESPQHVQTPTTRTQTSQSHLPSSPPKISPSISDAYLNEGRLGAPKRHDFPGSSTLPQLRLSRPTTNVEGQDFASSPRLPSPPQSDPRPSLNSRDPHGDYRQTTLPPPTELVPGDLQLFSPPGSSDRLVDSINAIDVPSIDASKTRNVDSQLRETFAGRPRSSRFQQDAIRNFSPRPETTDTIDLEIRGSVNRELAENTLHDIPTQEDAANAGTDEAPGLPRSKLPRLWQRDSDGRLSNDSDEIDEASSDNRQGQDPLRLDSLPSRSDLQEEDTGTVWHQDLSPIKRRGRRTRIEKEDRADVTELLGLRVDDEDAEPSVVRDLLSFPLSQAGRTRPVKDGPRSSTLRTEESDGSPQQSSFYAGPAKAGETPRNYDQSQACAPLGESEIPGKSPRFQEAGDLLTSTFPISHQRALPMSSPAVVPLKTPPANPFSKQHPRVPLFGEAEVSKSTHSSNGAKQQSQATGGIFARMTDILFGPPYLYDDKDRTDCASSRKSPAGHSVTLSDESRATFARAGIPLPLLTSGPWRSEHWKALQVLWWQSVAFPPPQYNSVLAVNHDIDGGWAQDTNEQGERFWWKAEGRTTDVVRRKPKELRIWERACKAETKRAAGQDPFIRHHSLLPFLGQRWGSHGYILYPTMDELQVAAEFLDLLLWSAEGNGNHNHHYLARAAGDSHRFQGWKPLEECEPFGAMSVAQRLFGFIATEWVREDRKNGIVRSECWGPEHGRG